MIFDMSSARSEYFEYIMEYLNGDGEGDEPSYRELLKILYGFEFKVVVEMDYNRVKNALYLRDHLAEEAGLDAIDDDYCSVLDILVHLADRMAFNVDRLSEHETGLRCYFWEMIENFGFGECTDADEDWDVEGVADVLDRWINRKYDNNGTDTPFPICHRVSKFSKFELWDQMQIYIEENYE